MSHLFATSDPLRLNSIQSLYNEHSGTHLPSHLRRWSGHRSDMAAYPALHSQVSDICSA